MDLLSEFFIWPIVHDFERLGLAIVLGALIGVEREARRKPAGLKTHAMVALGAASFTLVTFHIVELAGIPTDVVRSDPLRVVSGVIGGIGFLGAGAIIRAGGNIHGLTTAAHIWVVGAVGVACGAGAYRIAVLTSILVFVTMFLLGQIERWFFVDQIAQDKSPSGNSPEQDDGQHTPPGL